MDYKQNTSLIIKSLVVLFLLSGCSEEVTTGTNLEPNSLAIIGSHTNPIHYDEEIELEFGATGGDGVYRYRYIQNPDIEDREEDFVFNPLELTVENNDGVKPYFSLRGIIKSENGVEANDLLIGTFSYQIEITDGKTSHTQSYEYKLEVNKLTIQTADLVVPEGAAEDREAVVLLNLKKSGSTQVCDDIGSLAYEEKTLPNGVTVYPLAFDVRLSTEVVDPIKVYYRFSSKYNDTLAERDNANIGNARPNVDYLNEERSIIFNPGEVACVGYVNLLDDMLVEGNEELRVEFYDVEGATTDLVSGSQTITIADNEPTPLYSTEEVIRNEGDKVIGRFRLTTPYTQAISVQVSIDGDNTTANSDDYLLEPEGGIVTIAAGDLEATYTLSLLANDDVLNSTEQYDEIITIVTDIDDLLEVEPYTITINEWPLTEADEVISVSDPNGDGKAVSFDISEEGIVSILLQGKSLLNEEETVLTARQRDGTQMKLSNTEAGNILLSKEGVSVIPVKAGSFISSGDTFFAIVANVNGLYANVHRGGNDFIVAVFKLDISEGSVNQGFYQPHSLTQYGTNGDDEVLGVEFFGVGDVYIYGETTGTEFDGAGGTESNKGGADGFVYKLNLVNETPILSWDEPRFIGTTNDDKVVGLDVGRSDTVVQLQTTTTDEDVIVLRVSSATGRTIEELEQGVVATAQAELGKGVRFDNISSGAYFLVDSESALPEGGPSPTLSQDVNVMLYDDDGDVFLSKTLSTSDEDSSADIEYMVKSENIVVGGKTAGEFADNQRKEAGKTDAFLSIYTLDSSDADILDVVKQFGTQGNDEVIDIEAPSDNKIMVLWRSESVDETDVHTYRVSAFSSDGQMLSSEPTAE